jgi:gliding motility-associatede transport system auxiliary component
MASDFLKARQTRYGAYLAIYVIVIIAVLGAVNYLAFQNDKSFDSTANKRYTLSDQTQKIVKGLKNDVRITYFDKSTAFNRAKDLLERYSNLSSKMHVAYVDPDKKPDLARAAGIRTYGSIVVENGLKKQEAKSLSEEEVSGALIRSMKTGDRTACFATGSGELSIDGSERSGISLFKAGVEKNSFKTKTFSFFEKTEVPSDCSVVVIPGPKRDYLDPAIEALKKYLEGGGKVLFLIDPAIDFGKGDSNSGSPAIAKLLSGYGVTLDNDLVIDASGVGQLFGFNEASPIVMKYSSHPITSPMTDQASVFPIVRSMQVKAPSEKLVETSANSYATTKLTPPISIDPAKDKKGPFTLAAAGTAAGKGRFVVVGTSSAAANQMFGISKIGNSDLILNMMNWLTADEDLISIRPKDPEDRRISMTSRQMSTLFYTSVIFFPLVIIIAGVSSWWRKR